MSAPGPAVVAPARASPRGPLVIAHRGASGWRPEHTLAAYALAIEQGADYVEPDLVATRDGVLVARHENEIGGTTDVSAHPEFAARRTTRVIDGVAVTGWFTEDFTLAELKTLRARERIPRLRPANARHDGQHEIPTFAEILALVADANARRTAAAARRGEPAPRPVGVYPETKHPGWFRRLGLPLEEPLVEALHSAGYTGRDAPAFLQSFETGNLRALRRMTELPLVQLIEARGAPWDLREAGDARTYAELVTPRGLDEIAGYADAIGPPKDLVIARDGAGRLAAPTGLVAAAHARGLAVHAWTFRAENEFLPADLRRSADPAAHGDLGAELRAFFAAGIDGAFVDQPDVAVAVLRGR